MSVWKSLWRHGSRSIWRQAFILLTGLALGSPLCGQIGASISGTITDLTGGALPGASVTVKNLETGAVRIIAADEAGRYIVSSLEVGHYEVRAEKEGFSAEVRAGITLAVGQQAVVDLTLRVGQVQDSVVDCLQTSGLPVGNVVVTVKDLDTPSNDVSNAKRRVPPTLGAGSSHTG